ncbi:hypothetical protein K491DRAFT_718071 [Lophiostoma macrostomum CBS 122681]|uniref:Mid2 domain-containing protein n=1 Tax=Lophiostoma macrostomum CBS 122681 TaxID=1314788 RepID=A0A6A6T168_9PLEO|nr:hypothetical protein K491DRAFT_718071 [Lophiostoma macrostomum CBS 122681]
MSFSVLDSSVHYPSPTRLSTSATVEELQLSNSPLLTATTIGSADLTDASETGFLSLISLVSHPHSTYSGWRTQTRTATPSLQSTTASHSSNGSPSKLNASAVDTDSEMPHSLDKGAKIGIIVSITVVVILTLIAVGFCCFDGRQRFQKRREIRKQRRDADSNMLETEMQSGRDGKRDSKRAGLWDGLRIDPDVQHDNDDDVEKKEDILDRDEKELGSVPMWERVGKGRDEGANTKTGGRQEPERLQEWLPAYMPRERMSGVSSEGSSVGANIPAVAMSPLEKDVAR